MILGWNNTKTGYFKYGNQIFKDENNGVYTEIYVSVSGNFDGAYEESVTFKKHGH